MAENWKCPRCDAPVDDLRYSVSTSGTEYGTASLSDVNEEDDRIIDHDYSDNGDTNWEGDCEYECPHCDRSVDPSELIWIGDEDEEEEEDVKESKEPGDEEASHDIIRPEENIIEKDKGDSANRTSIICKECRHVLVCDMDDLDHGYHDYTIRNRGYGEKDEFFVVCTKCNHINSTIEFANLLKEGYFNQLNKNDNAKIRKNKHRFSAAKSKSR